MKKNFKLYRTLLKKNNKDLQTILNKLIDNYQYIYNGSNGKMIVNKHLIRKTEYGIEDILVNIKYVYDIELKEQMKSDKEKLDVLLMKHKKKDEILDKRGRIIDFVNATINKIFNKRIGIHNWESQLEKNYKEKIKNKKQLSNLIINENMNDNSNKIDNIENANVTKENEAKNNVENEINNFGNEQERFNESQNGKLIDAMLKIVLDRKIINEKYSLGKFENELGKIGITIDHSTIGNKLKDKLIYDAYFSLCMLKLDKAKKESDIIVLRIFSEWLSKIHNSKSKNISKPKRRSKKHLTLNDNVKQIETYHTDYNEENDESEILQYWEDQTNDID